MFASVMTAVILITIAVCSALLPSFYEKEKIRVIRQVYNELVSAYDSSDLTDSDYLREKLDDLSMKNYISVVMIGNDSVIRYSSRSEERGLEMILVGIILGMNRDADMYQEIETASDHSLYKISENGNTYLEMFGYIGDEYPFLIRTSMDSIETSAHFASFFYLIIGIIGIVAGAIITFFVSKRISDPIVELSESLEKSSREHREFISNVSHELKTPISLIRGYAEGLKEGVAADPESSEEYLDVIIDETDKMDRLVRDLLTIERIGTREQTSEPAIFDPYDLISGFLGTAGKLAEDDGIKLIFDEKSGNRVLGDPYMTETVFSNYFTNALHYCKETLSGKYIKIRFENRGKMLRVFVFNTGEQIPDEVLPRIWDKFYKADKARTRDYGGSGIGLSIVKASQESAGLGYGVKNCADGVEFWFDLECA